VASFGSVPAGDLSDVVKVGVGAVRAGFGVVPCHPGTDEPMCTLTATAAKKDPDHYCYHVLTDDKNTRTVLTRLTRNDAQVNLAVDLEASRMAVLGGSDNPTVIMHEQPLGDEWFEIPEGVTATSAVISTGHILVPPSTLDGQPLQLVGQTNQLPEEYQEMTQESIWEDPSDIEDRVKSLEEKVAVLQSVMTVILTELKGLKEKG
jgi:hypothetical protein